MALTPVITPFPVFYGLDGQPLDAGYIYIGTANLDPITNPITVYWDSALSITAAQPIRTLNGYPSRSGTPSEVFANSAFSILVKDYAGRTVYSNPFCSDSVSSLASDLANTSDPALGDALVGVKQVLTGAAATTQHEVNARRIDVFDFLSDVQKADVVAYTSLVDCTAALQAAIDSLGAYGGIVHCRRGAYLFTTLAMAKNVILRGEGRRSTYLISAGTGDGVVMTSPINSSTAVHVGIEDLQIACTNGANTGGGFVDVGGTYVHLRNVLLSGFKYGCIFDQTELATIDTCYFGANLTGGLWIVNGPDHTLGADVGYTNKITVKNCQFNEGASAYCIIDDGGISHAFLHNNYNGGLNHIRFANAAEVSVEDSELEGASGDCVTCYSTTLAGASVGGASGLLFKTNAFIPVATKSCIKFVSAASAVLLNNSYSSALSAAAAIDITSLTQLIAIGNRDYNGYSGAATYQFIRDAYSSNLTNFGVPSPASTGTVTASGLGVFEEGSFVPTIYGTTAAGAGTYSDQTATYQRIGHRVYFSANLVWSAHTGTGNMRLGGLPYTSSNADAGATWPLNILYSSLTATAGKQVGGGIPANSTYGILYQMDPAGGAVATVPIDTAASLYVSGFYDVA